MSETQNNSNTFRVEAPFEPAGDQPQAIEELSEGIKDGLNKQTL